MIYRLTIHRISILYKYTPKYARENTNGNIAFFEFENYTDFPNDLLKYRNIHFYYERNDTYDK